MLQLRPYQLQAVNQMRTLMQQGCKSILYQGATGSGKTALTAHMLHTAASKGMRSLFIVHRRELIKQSTRAFALEGVRHGIISAGFTEDRRHLVQLGSIQTLIRRAQRMGAPKLIVWDEAHHLASDSWKKFYSYFPQSFSVGLTATPYRLDGRGLGEFFNELIEGPSVQSLIAAGYLSPYKLYAPMRVSTEGIHTKMGDFVRSELSSVMDKPSITGSAVEHYRRYCNEASAVVFAVSVQHSQHITAQFQAAGIKAAHVDGETPSEIRDKAIADFKSGDVKVLSNVELFGEGFDVPRLECAILLRPTQSLGLYLQQVGRALRPAPGKTTAIILDHVGNCERFGLPDEDRTWSLLGREGRRRKNDEASTSVRVCPKCFAAQIQGRTSCKFCGFVFETKAREIEEKEGELEEVKRVEARKEQGHADSLEDLTRLGIARGYKFPRRWAYYIFKSRQAKRLNHV